YFRGNMVPVVLDTCEAQVHALGINAINNAASIIITEDLTYDELFEIQKNNNGDVVLIQARSPKINRIARELARLTQLNLESIDDEMVSIAIGTFSGVTLLIGIGPMINITIEPIGVANCDFVSEFITAGINQTIHKIYIDIIVDIEVALPLDDLSISVKSEILICENLIVGKVPDTYLNIGKTIEGLNLVP
ncbi:MAG: sporulation protein YunB, partial [Clostridia bacterium]